MHPAFGGVSEAAALFALSFLSEDAAVLSAAVMAAGGAISWELGFAASFLGIWIGDLWLYGMARVLGAPFVARFQNTQAVQRSTAWFHKRGSLVLVISRVIPGLRLPSYLAAGAMRFSPALFIAVTGLAAAGWVSAIFFGSKWLGLEEISFVRQHSFAFSAALVAVTMTGGVMKRWITKESKERVASNFRWRARLSRWTQWEFWPGWLFYTPVVVFYAWLSMRHRGLGLPTIANPGLPMGGLVGESKYATLDALQKSLPEFTARTWLIPSAEPASRITRLKKIAAEEGVELPFILKPDVGQRGAGVKLIRSIECAEEYLKSVTSDVLLQEYIPGPREVGVFYCRRPDEEHGRIFAITEKAFPVVIGDGVRTLAELIHADSRAAIMAETYLRRFAAERSRVPARGEMVKLVEAGNHAQGCIFRDGAYLNSPALEASIDRISQSIPGFFIGRYDVRYSSDEELRAGKGFWILELNGASAEATSIYDCRNSLRSAYATLYRQWVMVFEIAAANRDRGERPARLSEIYKAWRSTSAAVESYPLAD